MQQCGVALNFIAVDLVVAGVHNEENYLRTAPHCTAGDSCISLAISMESLPPEMHTGDPVARLDELILPDGQRERVPDGLAEFFDDTALRSARAAVKLRFIMMLPVLLD